MQTIYPLSLYLASWGQHGRPRLGCPLPSRPLHPLCVDHSRMRAPVCPDDLGRLNYPPGLIQGHNPVITKFLFISYSLILHLLAFFFPIRLCRSVYQANNAIEEVFQARREANTTGKEKCEDVPIFRQPSPSLQQEEVSPTPNETIHAIMVPSYKEDIGSSKILSMSLPVMRWLLRAMM
jgi:hypothetical protein